MKRKKQLLYHRSRIISHDKNVVKWNVCMRCAKWRENKSFWVWQTIVVGRVYTFSTIHMRLVRDANGCFFFFISSSSDYLARSICCLIPFHPVLSFFDDCEQLNVRQTAIAQLEHRLILLRTIIYTYITHCIWQRNQRNKWSVDISNELSHLLLTFYHGDMPNKIRK